MMSFLPRHIGATTGALLVLSVALASVALLPSAEACSPISCSLGRLVPAEGSTIPAGIRHLPFSVSSGADIGQQTVESMAVTIKTEAGETVPFEVVKDGYSTFLMADLPPNTTFKVQWTDPCYLDYPDTTPLTMTRSFKTGAALAAPTLTASVILGEPEVGTGPVPTSSGSCTTDVPAEVVPVYIRPSNELIPFLPLIGAMIRFDSWPEDFVPDNSFGNLPVSPDENGLIRVGQVWTRCGDPEPPDPGASQGGGYEPGQHTVSVRLALPPSTVAWATPQDASINLSCEPFATTPEPTPEVTHDLPAPVDSNGIADASPQPTSSKSNGCNAGSRTTSATVLLSFFLAWALIRVTRLRGR